MINYINENFDRHIITMEDPIEYYHHAQEIASSCSAKMGVDVPNFSEALRRALRQDPDVMLVGEMRDLATIGAAITAAETGHLVFGTLHTSGAASTINRIIDAFPTDQQEQVRVQLANNLIAVLSQALCPRVDTDGMVAAYEFMYVTPGIQNLIRENKSLPHRLAKSRPASDTACSCWTTTCGVCSRPARSAPRKRSTRARCPGRWSNT